MILDALALLGANACFLLGGVGILSLLRGPDRPARSADLGLGYMAGVAGFGVLVPLLLIAGLGVTVLETVLLAAGLFLAGLVRRRGRPARRWAPDLGGEREVLLVVAGVGLAFLALLAADFAFEPLFRTDAWAQWTPKARAITLFGGLDPRLFASVAYRSMNLDYPLLLPSIEAIDFRFMGFNTEVLHLQSLIFLAGYVAAVGPLVRDRVPRVLLWPVLLAVVVTPTVWIQAASVYADVPLAVLFSLAGLAGWRWLADGDRGGLALFGLFAAAVLATKNEGFVFVGALAIALVLLGARTPGRTPGTLCVVAVATLATVVPWRVWTAAHDVPANYSFGNAVSPGFLFSHLDRIPRTVTVLAGHLFDPTAWLLLLPLGLAAALIALRRSTGRRIVAFVLGTFALSLGGLIWTYWATPFDLEWHLGTSSTRVIVAPVLFCVSFAPLLVATALGDGRAGAAELSEAGARRGATGRARAGRPASRAASRRAGRRR